MFRNCDNVMEIPHRALFVVQHLLEFHAIQNSSGWILLSQSISSPNLTLHVVLEEDGGDREEAWQIHRCVEKITDCNVEAPLLEPSVQLLLNPNRFKSAHRIGNWLGEPGQIVEGTTGRTAFALPRTQANCPRKLPREFGFVFSIGWTAVVREKDEVMA